MGWVLSVIVCVCLCSMCWVESIVITTTKTASRWHMWCAQTCLRIDNVWRIDLTHVQLFLQGDKKVSLHLMITIPSSGAQTFYHPVLTNDHTSYTVHAILKERTKLCYSWSHFLRQHGVSKRLYLNYARYKYVRCSTQKEMRLDSWYSYSTANKMHLFSQIIYSCKTLYMFRTVFSSIIKSSKLRIEQRYVSNSSCYQLI
jgi:hypothetical protein